MAYDDFPAHLSRLIDNTAEVVTLLDLHTKLTGGTPGNHHRVEILNKSALVLLVACWEAYIEDLAQSSFDFLLKNASSPDVFPTSVLTEASKPLVNNGDYREAWQLAGEGWKLVLQQHRKSILDRYIGKLNTPRPKQINEMFEKLVGYKNLPSQWRWKGMSNTNAKEWLEDIITTRGEIAHTVKASKFVQKKYVKSMPRFVHRLAAISSNRLGRHLERRTGKQPWGYYSFGHTG